MAAQALQRAARFILRLEWPIVLILIAAFWFADPSRIWALLLWPPLLGARWVIYRRLWFSTPLDLPMLLLLALCVLNIFIAPYHRGTSPIISPWGLLPVPYDAVVIGRLLMGIAVATSFIDRAARRALSDDLLLISIGLALLIGILGLTAAQWSEKSIQLEFITRWIPHLRGFPGAESGFNVNEIAGAMAWFTPLIAALAVYGWKQTTPSRSRTLLRFGAGAAFVILWSALFLGQSRLSIVGVMVALVVITFLLVPAGRWRIAAFTFLGVFAIAQIVILTGVFQPQLASRDAGSASARVDIYRSAVHIVIDHPLTGVGLNMFRAPDVRAAYPVPGYETNILPHAHNEWLQVATDAGLPGLAAFAVLNVTLAILLFRMWRYGQGWTRALALGLACGLLAHAVFGMGDAITLWDRFTFAYWWLVGSVGAEYVRSAVAHATVKESLANVKTA